MRTRTRIVLRLSAALAAAVLALSAYGALLPHASAAAPSPTKTERPAPYRMMRLFYYQGGHLAKKSFLEHIKSIDIFAPQTYGLYDTGELVGSVDPALLAAAQKNGVRVMPLVTNDGFSRGAYQALLSDPGKQDAAIAALIAEAQRNGYWGWQIDFEQMDASYRAAFSAFVAKTAEALHARGLTLSVAVFAQHSENPADYTNNLWQNGVGVYDYAALGTSADFVSVMSYDDPLSAGPPAEWAWYKSVLEFSLKKIPAEKISFGIPLYYWLWNDTTGERIEAGGNAGIQHVFNTRRPFVRWSVKHHVPYLEYWKKGQNYTLWYENSDSIAYKLALIKKYRMYGFSAWALGLERPNVWYSVRS